MQDAAEVIADPAIDQLVVTDVVPAFRLDRRAQSKRFVTLPAAPPLAETIRRLHEERSLRISWCSEKHLKLSCTFFGQLKVSGSKPRPLFGRARMLFQKMRDGEPRAQRRAMATIKRKQLLGRTVTQYSHHSAFDKGADPSRTEPLALETESDLIKRIDHPKPRIEFEAVDDPDLIPQPNMFGTQVTMTRDDFGDGEGGRR